MVIQTQSEDAARRNDERYNELQHRLVLETFEQPLLTHEEEMVLGRKVELLTHLEERIARAQGNDNAHCAMMLLHETAMYRKDADLAWMALGARAEPGSPSLADICGNPDFRRDIDCREIPEDEQDTKRSRHEDKRRRIGNTHDGRVVLLSITTALMPPFLFETVARIAAETVQGVGEANVTLHHVWNCLNNTGTASIIQDETIHRQAEIDAHFNHIMQEGEDAIDELTERNTRLVMSIAKKYSYPDLEITDLFQEGNIGLIKAIRRYDFRRRYKFSTYATWWIRQSVSRNLGNERNIRLPDGITALLRKMGRAEADLAQQLGRETITADEIAAQMEVSPARVRELRHIRLDTQSLNEQLTDRDGEGSNTTRADLVSDGLHVTEIHSLGNVASMELYSIMKQTLQPDEIEALSVAFGLGPKSDNHDEIPRNRRLENHALAKLRIAMVSIGVECSADLLPSH